VVVVSKEERQIRRRAEEGKEGMQNKEEMTNE